MDATMTHDTATRTEGSGQAETGRLGFAAAFARQFRLIWSSRRALLLMILMLGLLALSGEPWNTDPAARLFVLWPMWAVLLGPLWAFAVWHGEGPSKRHYMWSQPVSRLGHTMARVAAGLAWLWIAYAVLVAAGIIFAASAGKMWQITEFNAGGWLNMFTGPMLGYLLFSILTVASDHPIRWAAGIFFGLPILVGITVDWLNVDPERLDWIAEPLANETWGLGVGMLGGVVDAIAELNHLLRDESGSYVSPLPDQWLLPALAWFALFAGILVWVAGRHPDTFPRWRRG